MGVYKPGSFIRALSKRRFWLLTYVLIVAVFGLFLSTRGIHWPTNSWLLIGLWLAAGIIRAMTKTPN